jgi:hypothetical protein
VKGKHFDEAEYYLGEAISLNPELVPPRINLAILQIARCDYFKLAISDERAISAACELAERAPDNPQALMWAAQIYVRGLARGNPNWEIAFQHLHRAIQTGLPLKALDHMPELKPMIKILQDRTDLEETLRNQPREPEKLVRQFELLYELGY